MKMFSTLILTVIWMAVSARAKAQDKAGRVRTLQACKAHNFESKFVHCINNQIG
jgi:hypothetical protein